MVTKYQIKDFIHREGVHCESSAMRDLFEYYGFPMSEAMAFGLDATMGFGFFDATEGMFDSIDGEIPFFFGGKQDTIKPNSLACRLLGINLRKQSFTSPDSAWQEAKIMIEHDIPLILQADLYYLDYFRFEDKIHFGGHMITLGGFDEGKGIAYIGDTEHPGFQELNLDKLKSARSSEHGQTFFHPKNAQYSMKPREDGKRPPLAAGIKLAIKQVVDNMLRPSLSNNGLSGLKKFASAIPRWKEQLKGRITNPYTNEEINLAKLMFELIYGYIETWGTGGGSFRVLYGNFLKELLKTDELRKGPRAWTDEEFQIIEECVSLVEDSAENWTLIAETVLDAAKEYKENCLDHVSLGELYNIGLSIASVEEDLFKKLMKIKI